MFKVIFNYIRSSRLAWDTRDFVSETKQKKKAKQKTKIEQSFEKQSLIKKGSVYESYGTMSFEVKWLGGWCIGTWVLSWCCVVTGTVH